MSAVANAWTAPTLDAFGKLQAGRLYVANRAPYYRQGIARLVPQETPGLGTVAVSAKGRLFWDGAAIDRWAAEANGAAKLGGAMAHELLHVLLNHAGRCEALGARSEEQRERWNIAADLAINVILRAGGWALPDGALYPEAFQFPTDLTAEQFYGLLADRDAQRKPQRGAQGNPQGGQGNPQPGGQGDAQGEGGAQGAQGAEQGAQGGAGGKGRPGRGKAPQGGATAPQGGPSHPHVGGGWCGSCAGRPVPQEPPADAPAAPGDATEADLERVRRTVAAAIQAAKQAGSVPAELARWADDMLQPPKVRWPQKLERACRTGIGVRSGVQDYTRTRPARRQYGIGLGVGKPVVPAMFSRRPKVAFAVDTSGSMGKEELSLAASEVQGVLRALGYPVEFMACDAKLHGVKRVARVTDMVDAVKGGGGTDFRPVFAHLEDEKFEGVLVYATDGFGPAPARPPRGIHVIWLLVGKMVQTPAPWGECVRVED